MITRVALQLKPALLVSIVTRCSAWYAISLSLQGPGTTITGLTLPSSAVTRLASSGWCSNLRAAPSEPGPKTIASNVRSEEHTSELQSHFNLLSRLLL